MFTTNDDQGTTTTIWVQNLAAKLGLDITPAFHVYNHVESPCPGRVSCTAYARGGARVTSRSEAGLSLWAGGTPKSSMPVVEQIDAHLARSNGTFKSTDLIIVWAGMNDVVAQMANWSTTKRHILSLYENRIISGAQGFEMYQAAAYARDAMVQAATELIRYVRYSIVQNGGAYVIVIGIPNFSGSPYGIATNETEMLSSLCDIFNQKVHIELSKPFDNKAASPFSIEFINPTGLFGSISQLGFENVRTPACDETKIGTFIGEATPTEWSLWCNTGAAYNHLASGASASTWFWADDVHPTTGGHRLLSDALWNQLRNVRRWVA